MRVLMLGASGFLGRPVQALLAAQDDLQVMTGPRSHDTDLARCEAGVWRDLLDAAQPDAVVNCAGRIRGSPEELQQANAGLVQRLVEAARGRRSPPHLVHLGSAAEYGVYPGAVTEDMPPRPESPYGQSKLAGTRTLLEAAADLSVHVLRVGNPVGAGQSAHTLLGRAAEQFRQALEAPTDGVEFGDLGAARDFIDARDVARAVLAVLRAPAAEPLLNVGRGEAIRARTLVRSLARI
ncbi:NAD-dependent epimerase/dehydratase family protein, partial [Deinococcus koreensis]